MSGRMSRRYGSAAYPETYLNRISATLAALTMVLESVAVFIVLFPVFRDLVLKVTAVSQLPALLQSHLAAAADWTGQGSFFAENRFVEGLYPALCVLILLLLAAKLILVWLEMGAVISLCASGRGARLIRLIHLIRMSAALVVTLVTVLWFVSAMMNPAAFQRSGLLKGQDESVVRVALAVVEIILLLCCLLVVFYHKDVAEAMSTAAYEAETGIIDGSFRKTHLSGISFVLGIPWIALLAAAVMVIIPDPRLLMQGPMAGTFLTLAVARAILHYAVSFCYRNMKRAR